MTQGSVWQADDDSMDVDDEYTTTNGPEVFVPSHALDALHWQAIDHFKLVFRNLADKLRNANGHGGPPVPSAHAPWFRRLALQEWTVENCLEYFNGYLQSQNQARLQETSPPIAVFLLRSQENLHGRRGRRGQDWSRQDWVNVAAGLQEVGRRMQDAATYGSAREFKSEVDLVFLTPMRPTGT